VLTLKTVDPGIVYWLPVSGLHFIHRIAFANRGEKFPLAGHALQRVRAARLSYRITRANDASWLTKVTQPGSPHIKSMCDIQP
jgi:hypothetical protein